MKTSQANRGKWLEDSVKATGEFYRLLRIGHIEKQEVERRLVAGRWIRIKSQVDFMGVIEFLPVAFDCKETKQASFPASNVKPHQIEMLNSFTQSGGIGFLLVHFHRRRVAGTFAISAEWYSAALTRLSPRQSIPAAEFHEADATRAPGCVKVKNSTRAPMDFAPAVVELAGRLQ